MLFFPIIFHVFMNFSNTVVSLLFYFSYINVFLNFTLCRL